MSEAVRTLPKSTRLVAHGAALPADRVGAVEGAAGSGAVTIKPMLVGDDMLLIETWQEKGVKVASHVHADHESMVYLIKGRMKLWIDGAESLVGPGDAWLHPAGVPHWSEALEECLTVEVKSPPRKTWA